MDKIKKSTGKNLFDNSVERKSAFPSTTVGSTVSYNNSSATYSYVNCCYINANTDYKLSWVQSGTQASGNARLGVIVDSDNKVLEQVYTWRSNASPITIRTTNSGYLILATDINATNIMIEQNSQATTYEPYGTNWYIEKNIGKVVLNGSESSWVENSAIKGLFQVTLTNIYNNNSTINAMSNLLQGNTGTNIALTTGYTDNSISTYSSNRLFFRLNSYANNLNGLKTFLSSNNMTVYYVHATPEYTIITDNYLTTQLDNLQDIILQPNLCYIDWFSSEKPNMTLKYNYLYISGSQTLTVVKSGAIFTYPVTLSSGYELDEGDSITYTDAWKRNGTTITDSDLLSQLNTLLNVELRNSSNYFSFSKPATLTVEFIPTTVTYEIASSDEPLITFKKGVTYTVNPGDYTIDFYTKIGSGGTLARITVTDNTIYFPTRDFNIYKIKVTLPTYTAISNKLQRWRLYEGTESENTYTIGLGSTTLNENDQIKHYGKWKINTTDITDSSLLTQLSKLEDIKLSKLHKNYINWHGNKKVILTLQYYKEEADG